MGIDFGMGKCCHLQGGFRVADMWIASVVFVACDFLQSIEISCLLLESIVVWLKGRQAHLQVGFCCVRLQSIFNHG